MRKGETLTLVSGHGAVSLFITVQDEAYLSERAVNRILIGKAADLSCDPEPPDLPVQLRLQFLAVPLRFLVAIREQLRQFPQQFLPPLADLVGVDVSAG